MSANGGACIIADHQMLLHGETWQWASNRSKPTVNNQVASTVSLWCRTTDLNKIIIHKCGDNEDWTKKQEVIRELCGEWLTQLKTDMPHDQGQQILDELKSLRKEHVFSNLRVLVSFQPVHRIVESWNPESTSMPVLWTLSIGMGIKQVKNIARSFGSVRFSGEDS